MSTQRRRVIHSPSHSLRILRVSAPSSGSGATVRTEITVSDRLGHVSHLAEMGMRDARNELLACAFWLNAAVLRSQIGPHRNTNAFAGLDDLIHRQLGRSTLR